MSGDKRQIQDPLFAPVNNRSERSKGGGRNGGSGNSGGRNRGGGSGSSIAKWVILAALIPIAVLGGVGYYVYENIENQRQEEREAWNAAFRDAQDEANQRLETLSEGFKTQIKTQEGQINRYRGQVSNLKSETATLKSETDRLKGEQEQQQRELQAINLQKADRGQVENLENETKAIQKKVEDANTNISDLRNVTAENRSAIDSNSSDITDVRSRADTTAGALDNFKSTFARDNFEFELEKKVFSDLADVRLRLTHTSRKKQRYNIEIFANGRKIKRKNQHVNVPIVFYMEGVTKPYELVVTKVGKDFVVGQLTVPKAQQAKQASVTG